MIRRRFFSTILVLQLVGILSGDQALAIGLHSDDAPSAPGYTNFIAALEINPALSVAFSLFAAAGLMFYHRARVKSRRQ